MMKEEEFKKSFNNLQNIRSTISEQRKKISRFSTSKPNMKKSRKNYPKSHHKSKACKNDLMNKFKSIPTCQVRTKTMIETN